MQEPIFNPHRKKQEEEAVAVAAEEIKLIMMSHTGTYFGIGCDPDVLYLINYIFHGGNNVLIFFSIVLSLHSFDSH